MLAPHPAAHEFVGRPPAGTIELPSWTPEGFIGEMSWTIKPYVPHPAPVCHHRRCGASGAKSAPYSLTG
jgi:hypothetical protein